MRANRRAVSKRKGKGPGKAKNSRPREEVIGIPPSDPAFMARKLPRKERLADLPDLTYATRRNVNLGNYLK